MGQIFEFSQHDREAPDFEQYLPIVFINLPIKILVNNIKMRRQGCGAKLIINTTIITQKMRY